MAGWLRDSHFSAVADGVRQVGSVVNTEPNYAAWWRRRWREGGFLGSRSPLEAVLSDPTILERLEQYLRAQF
jgi:hypothetical protein